jgi:hypothetical protein
MSRGRDVLLGGHIIGLGNHRGGKWGWGGKEEGGRGQFTSNLRPEWTGIASHAKEGFHVSKRDLGTGEGSSGRMGIIKGIHQRVIKGLVPCALM